jgi:hypothetical protein
MLRNREMWNCKSLIIFMNVSCRLIKISDEYIADKNLRINYQLIVRLLMYIMLKIRLKHRLFYLDDQSLRLQSHSNSLTSNQTHFSLFTRNTSNEIDVSRNFEIFKKLHEFELSKKSRYQTINFKIRFQRWQWRHQLIFETTIHRDIIYLRNRIYETNFSCKRSDLTTKLDDSVDMQRRIFSDDDNIRKQSKRYCFDQKFSVSRTNQAHRYSHSLHQRKSDWRVYWSVLRAHRLNHSWRFNQITDQKQIRSVSRCFRNWIISTFRDNDLWKLDKQIRIKSQNLFLYNLRSMLNVDFAYTERVRKKFLRLYDKFQKVQSRFDFNES